MPKRQDYDVRAKEAVEMVGEEKYQNIQAFTRSHGEGRTARHDHGTRGNVSKGERVVEGGKYTFEEQTQGKARIQDQFGQQRRWAAIYKRRGCCYQFPTSIFWRSKGEEPSKQRKKLWF